MANPLTKEWLDYEKALKKYKSGPLAAYQLLVKQYVDSLKSEGAVVVDSGENPPGPPPPPPPPPNG